MRKNNKRILSVGLVLCMIISLFSQIAYAEDKSAFVSGQYETVLGENVEVELKATDSAGVIALLCEIEFDSEYLEILRYDDAKLIGGTLTAKTDESPMRLFWMDALAKENTLVEGTLGTFTFRTLKPGKTEINVNYKEAFNKDGDLVPFEDAVIEVNVKETDVPVVETKEYTIKALAGANGRITPSGEIKAIEGKQLLFIFTPDSGYKVDDVKVDGKSIGEILEYTYESVNADSTIEVIFRKLPEKQENEDAVEPEIKEPEVSQDPTDVPVQSGDSLDNNETVEDEEVTEEPEVNETENSQGTTNESVQSGGSSGGSYSGGGTTSGKSDEKTTVKTDDETTVKEETKTEEEPEKEEWVNPFSDVKTGDWYYEYVKYINEKKLMDGISETKFAPNNTVTRAMFVTVLYRLEKEPTTTRADFTDIQEGAYYENAVGWAVQNRIVNGVSETQFAPNNTITREQMATIIYRYMEFKGLDVSEGENADITSFEDFESISPYAQDAFRYACSKGIISGTSSTTLSPKKSATRAQMAAIFRRCENLLLNQ